MAETALVVLIPELEPLIGDWRRRYTGDGARDMPPHVTLIYPFADAAAVDKRLETVARVLSAFGPFPVDVYGTSYTTVDASSNGSLEFTAGSPLLNVGSKVRPLSRLLMRVRTNAEPFPGLTCWNSMISNVGSWKQDGPTKK